MMDLNSQQWHGDAPNDMFLISTQKTLLDHTWINNAFATEEMFWAKPLPTDQLAFMLENSVTAAIYEVTPSIPLPATVDEPSSPREGSPTLEHQKTYKQIGMARLVTDQVTFAYLSDVYIESQYRGHGLARWLIGCIRELIEMHSGLRRLMLFTSDNKLSEFYTRELGVWNMAEKEGKTFVMSSNKVSASS